jgi:hypothetical protein
VTFNSVLTMQRTRQREETPTLGSQVVTPTESNGVQREEEPVVLRLQVVPDPNERRVTWDEEVIDNENMGKKSSKGIPHSRLTVLMRSMLYIPSTSRIWRVILRREFFIFLLRRFRL